jgi:hypothetical protein
LHTEPEEKSDFISYSKEALAKFKKIDYKNGLNGHWDIASMNTLRNSVRNAINMDSATKRFKLDIRGG